MALAKTLWDIEHLLVEATSESVVVMGLSQVINDDKLKKACTILWVEMDTKVEQKLVDQLPNLKIVVSPTTGLTHVDIDLLKSRKIELISLQGELEFLETITSTSEFAWGLILAIWRRLGLALNESFQNRQRLASSQLKDKTIGIIGMGRIGRRVSLYAKSFEMKIITYDPYIENSVLPESVKRVSTIEQLLSLSDIILISASVIQSDIDNYPLLGAEQFEYVKHGSVVVNVARGILLDECAALGNLESGKIAGIGLDVSRSEDIFHLEDSCVDKLRALGQQGFNVIITPHIGGASRDAYQRVVEFMITKLNTLL